MVKELRDHLETTLFLGVEIDFNKRPSKKMEDMVLRGLHSTLTIFKRAGWISDYTIKGGELSGM